MINRRLTLYSIVILLNDNNTYNNNNLYRTVISNNTFGHLKTNTYKYSNVLQYFFAMQCYPDDFSSLCIINVDHIQETKVQMLGDFPFFLVCKLHTSHMIWSVNYALAT